MEMDSPMTVALLEAERAAARGEVPVGAVLVDSDSGDILTQAGNRTEADNDPTADLYVTLEPCTMCAAAISFARIRRLYFGAYDPKGGGVEHGARFFQQATCHHAPEVIGGVEESRAATLLKVFFADLRRKK